MSVSRGGDEARVTSSLASRTSSNILPSEAFIRSGRNPLLVSPIRFERMTKAPGSRKLVLGKWVEVKPEDDDATFC